MAEDGSVVIKIDGDSSGMLTNLAKPSEQVAQYMDSLGLALTDSAGQMRPLSELIEELREKFSGLTEAQKAEYAAGIAGKEAMSGLLAIVNASESDFQKLTHEIENANGTAHKQAWRSYLLLMKKPQPI